MRILIVDSDVQFANKLSSDIRELRSDWFVDTTDNPVFAVEILAQREFDVLISDLQIPQMVGDELLKHARNQYPKMIRFLLTEDKTLGAVLKSAGEAHSLLPKPCDAKTLVDAITRAHTLRIVLRSEELQAFVTRTTSLPGLPEIYIKLIRLLQEDSYRTADIVDCLNSDIALTATLLKVANSSYYARHREVSNVRDAVTLLGTQTVRALVLAAETFSAIQKNQYRKFNLEALWTHSLQVGSYAARIAELRSDTKHLRDDALTAGILHDIGKLVFIINSPADYKKALAVEIEQNIPAYRAERRIFGVSHQEIGAYLLSLWGLPDSIVEAVIFHHRPEASSYRALSVLSLVTAANTIAHEQAAPALQVANGSNISQYFKEIASPNEFEEWRAACSIHLN